MVWWITKHRSEGRGVCVCVCVYVLEGRERRGGWVRQGGGIDIRTQTKRDGEREREKEREKEIGKRRIRRIR